MSDTIIFGAASRRMSLGHSFAAVAVASLAGAAAVGETFQVTLGAVVSLLSLIFAVIGIRRARPEAAPAWWLLTTGAAAFLVGTGVAAISASVAHLGTFPSAADAFFLAGYGCLILGGLLLLRHKQVDRQDDDILDSVIAAAAVGVVLTTYVVYPYLRDPDFGLIAKGLTVGYAIADLVLVSITARVAVSGRRPTSYYLVAASLAAVIATDALTTLYHLGTVPASWVAAVSPLGYVLFAAAALDPSMTRLVERIELRDSRMLSGRRIALLFMALLLVPSLLTAHVALGRHPAAVPVLAAGSIVMAMLVVGRLVELLRGKERQFGREEVLRCVSASLVAATTHDQMYQAALDGVARLLSGCALARVAITEVRAGSSEVVAAVGHRSPETAGARLALDALSSDVTDEPFQRRSVLLSGVAPIDVPLAEGERANVLLVPLSSRVECCGAFVITVHGHIVVEVRRAIEDLAGQLSLALETASLTEQIHRRRHERRFRILVEHSSDLVGVLDQVGALTFVSPASSRLLGVAPRELVGRPILDRVHHDDRAKLASTLSSTRDAGGTAGPAEVRLLHADGAWRWFEVVVNDAAAEPEVRGLVIHARDVTERKAAERSVIESEARFRSLVQNATDLVMVVDGDGTLMYVSPSVTTMLGYSAEQLLGTSWLDLVERADAANAARLVADPGTGPPPSLELRVRSVAGSYSHLELKVSDLRHDPAVGGIVMNGRNVTERRQSEERWRVFAAEASHQLRTPLTGLRLSLENLITGSSANPVALQEALAQVDRLQSTVEDFLALAPRRVPPVEPLDVGAVLADVEASWSALVLSAGRQLAVHVDGSLPIVFASAAAVRQVLGVLIENALRHGTGGIGVAARGLVGGLAVEVSDEGRGLPTAIPGPTSRHDAGSGIGLTLARSLAEAEGGRLVVRRAGPSPAVALVLPGRPT